ncbi:CubicO group peptidase (beta-lactamase class C family) [Sphingomonas trueperi]|uniref:serine hydrolase domain-containing protein n=1 Tax=Sphingomonas trueperi TaxID=53317 RepID=UPI00339547C8
MRHPFSLVPLNLQTISRVSARLCRTFLATTLPFLLIGTNASAQSDAQLTTVLVAAKQGTRSPSMGAALIRDGKVVASAVTGVRRTDRAGDTQIGDSWIIGSTGKPQTAAMIARLVDRGVLTWSMPLSAMLPELADQMRPEYRSVTLVQLLSHHAGLPENVGDMPFIESFLRDRRPLNVQRLAYVARALGEPPSYVPGSDFGYSNSGFLIAAAIAERATGKTYETLMRREVFRPLGMSTAGFGATPAGQPTGHEADKPVGPSNSAMFAPAGNLHMSVGDWARFCVDQLAGAKGKGKLLSPASYRVMQTAQPNGPTGLDWGVQASIAGRKGPVLVHSGSDGYWFAYAVLFPASGNGVLVIDNASQKMGGDAAGMAALKEILPTLAPAN